MARYWVNVPGEGKPIELSLEELVARQREGKLPAGTLAVLQGSEAWAPVESIDEVKAALAPEARTSNAPPSSAAQGVDLLEAPPSLGVSPNMIGAAPPDAATIDEAKPGAQAQPTNALPLPPPPPPPPKTGRSFLLMIAVAAALLLGSGSLLCVWLRYGYARTAVFEHVPSDCTNVEYVDFAGIDDTSPMKGVLAKRDRALADWEDDLDAEEGVHASGDDDSTGRSATLRALRKADLKPYGDVKEIVYCETSVEGGGAESMLVVGGTFRGKEILSVLRSALQHRDKKHTDDDLRMEEVDGRSWLKLDGDRWATTATSQIVLLGPRKLIEKHLVARPVARSYGLKDEIIFRRRVADASKSAASGASNAIELERWTFSKGKLVYVRELPAIAGAVDPEKTAADALKVTAEGMRAVDGMDALADAWADAEVKASADVVRTTLTWTASDVTTAAKALVDADTREIKRMSGVIGGAPGAEFFRFMFVPGVDAFGLRLAPW